MLDGDALSFEGSGCTVPTNTAVGDIVCEKYRLSTVITSGSSGEVWRVGTTPGVNGVAVKIMFVEGRSIQATRAREVATILGGSGSDVARYIAWTFGSGVHKRHECLLFDLYGMNIRRLYSMHRAFPIPSFQIRSILWQVCKGVAFLHGLDIIHTDIKPDNVVFVDDTLLTVRDVDSCGQVYEKSILKNVEIRIVDLEDSVSGSRRLHYIPGTPGYRPPEVYGRSGWTFPVDVFAIGCMAYEMWTGVPLVPWTEDVREYMYFMEKAIGMFNPLQAQDICELYRDMFRMKTRVPRVKAHGMCIKALNKLKRCVVETKWLRRCIVESDIKEFIVLCTKVDPWRRLSIESAVRHRAFNVHAPVSRRMVA